MPLHQLAESPALRIHFDSSQQWLFAQWYGMPTPTEMSQGYELLLSALATRPSYKILTDSSEWPLRYEWPQAMRQLRQQFWRRAAGLGVQLIAEVLPSYSSASAHFLAPKSLCIACFDEPVEAYTWLTNHTALPHPNVFRSTPTSSTTTRRPSLFRFHFSTLRRVLSPFSSALAVVGPAVI